MVQLPPSATEVAHLAPAPGAEAVPAGTTLPVVPITTGHLARAARATAPFLLCAAVGAAIVAPALRGAARQANLIDLGAPQAAHAVTFGASSSTDVQRAPATVLAPLAATPFVPVETETPLDLFAEPTPAPVVVEPEPAPAPEPEAVVPEPAAPVAPPPPPAWQPANVARIAFDSEIEQWRPLVRQMLAEAAAEGRLTGAARKLDDDLLLAMIQQESAGDATAESWAGAMGLMQLMPGTFSGIIYGDWSYIAPRDAILDPVQNVRAGVRYMAEALQIHGGDLYWSVASYNAGAGATKAWLSVGLPAVPPVGGYWETADYAPRILGNYAAHRPGLAVYIPDPITEDQLPGVIALLTNAGLW
ncbi:MAG TPA: lytic transglycosylase domain-containing protein [Chloroflexota bacterium]|nr:lytic transglycosylase domain-containing protein [Chloroflexota bacterium]